MKFYIREWNENTIVLMTENGHVLSYFTTIGEALHACSEWYNINRGEQKYEVFVQYKQENSSYTSTSVSAAA